MRLFPPLWQSLLTTVVVRNLVWFHTNAELLSRSLTMYSTCFSTCFQTGRSATRFYSLEESFDLLASVASEYYVSLSHHDADIYRGGVSPFNDQSSIPLILLQILLPPGSVTVAQRCLSSVHHLGDQALIPSRLGRVLARVRVLETYVVPSLFRSVLFHPGAGCCALRCASCTQGFFLH